MRKLPRDETRRRCCQSWPEIGADLDRFPTTQARLKEGMDDAVPSVPRPLPFDRMYHRLLTLQSVICTRPDLASSSAGCMQHQPQPRASSPRQHRAGVQDLGAECQMPCPPPPASRAMTVEPKKTVRRTADVPYPSERSRPGVVLSTDPHVASNQARQIWFHGRQVGIKFLQRRLSGCRCGASPTGRAVCQRNSSRVSPGSEYEIADRQGGLQSGAVEIDARSRTRV